MAFNPYYNTPYYQQPQNNFYNNGAAPDMLNQMKGQYTPPIMNGGLLWVDNEEQAKNYLVAPNNVVPMFDKNKAMLYVKGADGAGMPNFKKYVLTEFEETTEIPPEKHECKCGDNFATKEEVKALEEKFNDILAKLPETKKEAK